MTHHDTILAIDCSTGPCSVALMKDSALLSERGEPTSSAQARLLVPLIQNTLQDAGVIYGELSLILCTTGPGSFTGIRIGLATARATGFAANIAVKGVSTLSILAEAARQENPNNHPIACLLQAGKNQLYAQIFNSAAADKPCLVDIPSLADYLPKTGALLCGNAAHEMLEQLPYNLFAVAPTAERPQARYAAQLAMRDASALCAPTPLYIRLPDAIVPAKPITAA